MWPLRWDVQAWRGPATPRYDGSMFKGVFLCMVLCVCQLCQAWGGTGHQLVALIAEDELTPKAKAAIADLLGPDVHISDAEVASWADEYRRSHEETSSWHYTNVPVTADRFDRARDGRNGANVVDALDAQIKILADKSAPREKRVDALKFVVHLVGDIHQPLHCADRNDKGGNTRLVFYPGQREAVNLHTVWDTWLLRDLMGKRRVAEIAAVLERSITPQQRKEWEGAPEGWANESHRAAVNAAYRDVPADGPPPTLAKAYIDRTTPVVAEQIKRAGVRLAAVLNAVAK
jgi:hypothetical protein